MQIRPFELERYYEQWEFKAELMLSSSDCESRGIEDLLSLEPGARERLLEMRLGYTEVAGSEELREAVAALYELVQPSDVLTLAAAEEGIFIAYHALLSPGDHVIVETPCYGAAIEVARSTGAEVSLWQRHHSEGWVHDIAALEGMLRASTKLIYVNSPHNPTGVPMTRDSFDRLIELAAERSLVLFSDEVYRGLEHDRASRLPAASDVYEGAISLNTVSKAYGLPGLRIGWLASRDPALIARIRDLKLYTTICSSAPSELLVALALRNSEQFVEHNRQLVLGNLPLLEEFLSRHDDLFEWVRPSAGPTGFPRILGDFDVRGWCEGIAANAGVLLLPGTVYDEPRHVRLGFGRANLEQAIERLEGYLD